MIRRTLFSPSGKTPTRRSFTQTSYKTPAHTFTTAGRTSQSKPDATPVQASKIGRDLEQSRKFDTQMEEGRRLVENTSPGEYSTTRRPKLNILSSLLNSDIREKR